MPEIRDRYLWSARTKSMGVILDERIESHEQGEVRERSILTATENLEECRELRLRATSTDRGGGAKAHELGRCDRMK